MNDLDSKMVVQGLFDAFHKAPKPAPLSKFDGSHCDEEVEFFNRIDWDDATYKDFVDGIEGWIICPESTVVYLIPRLFKMLILGRSNPQNSAVDNLSGDLESRVAENNISERLNEDQKLAILRAWKFLDENYYKPSGSNISGKLAKLWNIDFL